MKLLKLLEKLDYEWVLGETEGKKEQVLDREISSVVYDSRYVIPGCIFVCIKGAVYDGHEFADIAAEVFGDGCDMWVRSQGKAVELLSN